MQNSGERDSGESRSIIHVTLANPHHYYVIN